VGLWFIWAKSSHAISVREREKVDGLAAIGPTKHAIPLREKVGVMLVSGNQNAIQPRRETFLVVPPDERHAVPSRGPFPGGLRWVLQEDQRDVGCWRG
jgi:hypothetical protein